MPSSLVSQSIRTLENLLADLDRASLSFPAIHVATAIDALRREADRPDHTRQ